jgi:hypothetical protein
MILQEKYEKEKNLTPRFAGHPKILHQKGKRFLIFGAIFESCL